ncbi:MAG TPA: tRNA (N(6)-L-threonylcarbamoyladenosine(37)-C(2))-methylthiotransferase MtaB [Firmicutes bacterium]|nr:tRNA (N(6)-L-threonylcarbamoyladenosine(37)-C(2))-methylthiotransferase MtaB [Bacillota bacterium]
MAELSPDGERGEMGKQRQTSTRATSNERRATSVAFYTLGCKVNQFDTDGLTALFRERGYQVVDFTEPAHIYIINTCTVTKTAEQKARQLIRKVKREHPGALVVVTGCYAQTSPDAVTALPEVDLVIGVAGRSNLVNLIEKELFFGLKNQVVPWKGSNQFEIFTPDFTEKTRAFLKIEDGCQSYCSYCKIPFARGPVRSLPPAQVKIEIERLLGLGYKKIVLVGIHLGDYGKDLGCDLASLLASINQEWEGKLDQEKWRLRLGSIEPADFSPSLIEVLFSSRLLCHHLHIPLQSGSKSVLSRMNRKYSPDDYAGLVSMLRRGMPRLGLTTDLMVGFPGETEQEFEETLKFLQAVDFSRIHIFPYSKREGTKAARMEGHLPRKIKEQRVQRTETIAEELAKQFRLQFSGKTVEVLVEQMNPGGYWEGFSREYLRVQVKGNFEPNTLLQAVVVSNKVEPLTGEVI